MNIVRPTLSMMPVEDLAAELRSNKPGRNFMTKEDKAHDVEEVAGIKAELIAQAVAANNRTTVKNALNLGNKPAEDYLDKEEGEKILKVSDAITEIFGNEIRDTRDEMYQIKSELVKSGLIADHNEYKGLTDSFKRHDKKYTKFICKIDKPIIGDTNELFINDVSKKYHFEKGKNFIIKEKDTGVEHIVSATEVFESGKVNFTPSVRCLDNIENIELLKSNGEYIGGSYSFSEVKTNVVSQKEKLHMQSDDTFTSDLSITKSNAGYAVFFKVPDKAVGALASFEVTAACQGTPGDLICYVLKKEAAFEGNLFVPSFKSIADAKEKGFVVATSKPIRSSRTTAFKEVSFDFSSQISGEFPLLEADENGVGKQYIFIIECVSATENDLWKIRFSHHEKETPDAQDLQRNNMSFVFEEIPDRGLASDEAALQIKDGIENSDMLFTLTTREVLAESEIGKNKGMYTAELTLPESMDVSQARFTTRINREGCHYIENIDASYCIFTLAKEEAGSYVVTDTRFREDDKIIIGNQIGTVKRVSGNTIELKEPAYIDERLSKLYRREIVNPETNEVETETRVPVYRLNYDITLKPYLIDWNTWDNVEGRFKTEELSEVPLKMELKAVIPDGNKKEFRVSDRLVFEVNFGEDINKIQRLANDFEFQINWKSDYTDNEINAFIDNKDGFKELIGRMHDIILTFNKNY